MSQTIERLNAITASRDKTTIIRDRWTAPDQGQRQKLIIRSNRVALALRSEGVEGQELSHRVVIRGKSQSTV
ncbi:MAG: hypothetical protein AAF220_11210, partial [Pseudomonadota bacterium]